MAKEIIKDILVGLLAIAALVSPVLIALFIAGPAGVVWLIGGAMLIGLAGMWGSALRG